MGDLFEHFRDVNSSEDADESNNFLNENDIQQEDNPEINGPITLEEINKSIRKLKNSKSSGIDMTLNEHIKAFWNITTMNNLYLNLFNLVFDTGIAPKVWSTGCILSIYKQKGNISEPASYRPITLLSLYGKLIYKYYK